MKSLNRFLILAIAVVLLLPGAVDGTIAEACCGVDVTNLQVTDSPDPVCLGVPVAIDGSYFTYSPWGPWTELYDTGVDIKIFDSGSNLVDEYNLLLGEDQGDPGDFPPGKEWTFSQNWTAMTADTYTYEVIAWSETSYGRMEISVVGETITVEEGQCPTIDCLVEKEIRHRWELQCPSCDEAKNHGEYVSCRAKIVDEYVEMGLVDEEGASCLINPEARSDCGKK